uniref:Protein kinase domain-containing protein n=1 Tax=Macrostomum lignano TaxID=282301 RepID=A0A1I8I6B1_9PLAT
MDLSVAESFNCQGAQASELTVRMGGINDSSLTTLFELCDVVAYGVGEVQQASVHRINLLLERVRHRPDLSVVQQDGLEHRLEQRHPLANERQPRHVRVTPQILMDAGNQTASVDELLTTRKLRRLSICASAQNCSLDVVRHEKHDSLLRVDYPADTRRNGNKFFQLFMGAFDISGQQGEVVGVAKHAESPLQSTSTYASPQQKSVVVGRKSGPQHPHPVEQLRSAGLKAGTSMLIKPRGARLLRNCDDVHRGPFIGASSPKSTRFITLTTSLTTQWMRSASMRTSSGPSAFPPCDCWASLTTSAVLTGARLKLSSAGNGISGGSVRLSGSGGGSALTMVAKNSRSSFLRSSAESPARFSGMHRFRPVRALIADQTTRPLASGPAAETARMVSSTAACLCCKWAAAKASSASRVGRLLKRSRSSSSLACRIAGLERDCLFRGGSNCSAHLGVLGTSTLAAERSDESASKAAVRVGVPERAVVAPRWPLRWTIERIVTTTKVADEESMIGPQSKRRDGAAIDDAAALEEAHQHMIELVLRKRVLADTMSCLSRKSSSAPVLPFSRGVEDYQCITLRRFLQLYRELLKEFLSLVRAFGRRRVRTEQASVPAAKPNVDPEQPRGQRDAVTALLQPRSDQRSNSSMASLDQYGPERQQLDGQHHVADRVDFAHADARFAAPAWSCHCWPPQQLRAAHRLTT